MSDATQSLPMPKSGPESPVTRIVLFVFAGLAAWWLTGVLPGPSGRMAALAVVMAVFWVFELVPLPVTALFPIVAMPLLGLADLKLVTANYAQPTVFLFLGGFLLALALQRCGLHRRIALAVLRKVGAKPTRLILGFMIASALLSMWISNTATAMVMLPIALSVIAEVESLTGRTRDVVGLSTALMLGIAYAADMGGMATPVGTPPNLVFMTMLPEVAPDVEPVTFAQWLVLGLPLSITFLAMGSFLLGRVLFRFDVTDVFADVDVLDELSSSLGRLRRDELLTGLVFGATALLWVTGADLRWGETFTMPGWRSALGLEGFGDGAVAIGGAILLFVIPSADRDGEALMDWETARDVPWGLLLLYGGGFSLAMGFRGSGLSEQIAGAMTGLEGTSPPLLVLVVNTVLTFLTELTSNTATTSLVLPILADAAPALGVDPRLLMIPATLSASCAFMMPVASPTQAVVFGSGHVTIKDMVRCGFWFNVIGVLLVTIDFFVVGVPLFGIEL